MFEWCWVLVIFFIEAEKTERLKNPPNSLIFFSWTDGILWIRYSMTPHISTSCTSPVVGFVGLFVYLKYLQTIVLFTPYKLCTPSIPNEIENHVTIPLAIHPSRIDEASPQCWAFHDLAMKQHKLIATTAWDWTGSSDFEVPLDLRTISKWNRV